MKILVLALFLMLTQSLSSLSAKGVLQTAADSSTHNIYTVRFPKNRSRVTIGAYMLGLANPVTFIVHIKRGKTLSASVRELGEKGNIRINQIMLPDGSSEGPFSKSLKYPVKQKGTYKIIVGGSNMQGDDWKGAFNLRLRIQ